ncbi:MAG: hypothetical protein HY754_01835 [Nitrospirae bacterium]|nr:hypothetical protein [Nitrospirota bacterium]
MATTIPIKVYEILEDRLGKEEAKQLVHEIETSVDAIAAQKKVEIRDELSKELLTKAEFHSEMKAMRAEMATMEQKLLRRMDIYFIIIICLLILLNPRAIDLIAKLLGIIK